MRVAAMSAQLNGYSRIRSETLRRSRKSDRMPGMDPHERATSVYYRVAGLVTRERRDLAVDHRGRDPFCAARGAARGCEAGVERRADRDRPAATRPGRTDDPADGTGDVTRNEETVECPKCGARVRLTPEEADYDELIVSCPKCGDQFDWERPAQYRSSALAGGARRSLVNGREPHSQPPHFHSARDPGRGRDGAAVSATLRPRPRRPGGAASSASR